MKGFVRLWHVSACRTLALEANQPNCARTCAGTSCHPFMAAETVLGPSQTGKLDPWSADLKPVQMDQETNDMHAGCFYERHPSTAIYLHFSCDHKISNFSRSFRQNAVSLIIFLQFVGSFSFQLLPPKSSRFVCDLRPYLIYSLACAALMFGLLAGQLESKKSTAEWIYEPNTDFLGCSEEIQI